MAEEQKTKGRNKLYTDEVLNEIVEQYTIKYPNVTKLIPSKIANFAREEFGFEKIRYSQFINNKKIKNKIDKFNKTHREVVIPNKTNPMKVAKINTDALIDAYYKEPVKLKSALRQFADKYTDVCRENIKHISKINTLDNEIQGIKNEYKELEEKYKKIQKEKAEETRKNKENATKIAHANRIEKFIRSIDVYKDLLEGCKVNPMDETNLRLLLANAGLLKETETVDITQYSEGNVSDGIHCEQDESEIESDGYDYSEEVENEMSE